MLDSAPQPGKRIDRDPSEVAAAASVTLSKSTAEILKSLPEQIVLERLVNERLAAEFLGLSYDMTQLRDEGRGPTYIRLDDRRLGYRVRDLMAWCEARKRPGGITPKYQAAASNHRAPIMDLP